MLGTLNISTKNSYDEISMYPSLYYLNFYKYVLTKMFSLSYLANIVFIFVVTDNLFSYLAT